MNVLFNECQEHSSNQIWNYKEAVLQQILKGHSSQVLGITDIWKSVRLTHVEGQIPSSCSKCFEEKVGVVSKRVGAGTGTKSCRYSVSRTNKKEAAQCQDLLYLRFRIRDTCNIKCVMCSPR